MNIIVIGGGAAGMMAAIAAAEAGAQVTLLEKNEKLGKKIYITGKGRCNVTNACDISELFDQVVSNPRFLYSALYGFTNTELMQMLEAGGCALKTERGARVFPVTDRAYDVTDCLKRYMQRAGVKLRLNTEVKRLLIEDDAVCGVECTETLRVTAQRAAKTGGKKELLHCDRVIVATGGMSYPSTGSTGDGYRFAKAAGLSVTALYPALVPLETEEPDCAELQGLSLKNIEVCVTDEQGRVYERAFGELLFTHFGLSGPVVLSASSKITGLLNAQTLKDRRLLTLHINLKPALSEKQLDERILRDFEEAKNRQLRNALDKLFPSKLIPVILKRLQAQGVDGNKRVNELKREERRALVELTRDLSFTLRGTRSFNEAIVTQGGVSVKELDPGSMEAKKVKGLYFAGEVVDIDAFTGGFNLQLAFSTGRLAGVSAAEEK